MGRLLREWGRLDEVPNSLSRADALGLGDGSDAVQFGLGQPDVQGVITHCYPLAANAGSIQGQKKAHWHDARGIWSYPLRGGLSALRCVTLRYAGVWERAIEALIDRPFLVGGSVGNWGEVMKKKFKHPFGSDESSCR
jgi:hypothetical protein